MKYLVIYLCILCFASSAIAAQAPKKVTPEVETALLTAMLFHESKKYADPNRQIKSMQVVLQTMINKKRLENHGSFTDLLTEWKLNKSGQRVCQYSPWCQPRKSLLVSALRAEDPQAYTIAYKLAQAVISTNYEPLRNFGATHYVTVQTYQQVSGSAAQTWLRGEVLKGKMCIVDIIDNHVYAKPSTLGTCTSKQVLARN